MTKPILVIAGEASADLHTALVVRRLKEKDPTLKLYGVGGQRLQEAGVSLLATAKEIAVMGFVEILTRLIHIYRIFKRILTAVKSSAPAVAVLVDLPDFNLRLAKKLHQLGIPVIYFISPQIWAWRKRRIKKIAKYVDEMIVIFPFEVGYYQNTPVQVHYKGHPLMDRMPPLSIAALPVRASQKNKTIALFPGSRLQELRRHFPVFMGFCAAYLRENPETRFILPLAETVTKEDLKAIALKSGHLALFNELLFKQTLRILTGSFYEEVALADFAIVTSGTATLEVALLTVPMVIVYRTSCLSYWIARLLVKVPYIGIVNFIAGRQIVPELIQSQFTVARLFEEVQRAVSDPAYLLSMKTELAQIRERLGKPGVAAAIGEVIYQRIKRSRIETEKAQLPVKVR